MRRAVNTTVFGSLHTKTSVSSNRAKMQWSLSVLILMGQCCFFMCQLYEYHFIQEEKTWEEAQNYCRENYTDLATVYDMTDIERLLNSKMTRAEAWIGLYNNPGRENRTWHWSLPGLEYNDNETQWDDDEPNDRQGTENCVGIDRNKTWYDVGCHRQRAFICYNETKQPNECVIYERKVNWSQAQEYCREHHTDLISGLNQLNQLNNISDDPASSFWIGLFRDTWRWSDGSNSSFRNWDREVGEGNKKCALLESSGNWRSAPCHVKKSFFCYDENIILIEESKTWEEALEYCREHYYDLISVTNRNEQRWVQEKAKKASTRYVWTGLRYTCTLDFWFWVSDETVDYQNWKERKDDCYMSGAMETGGEHQWYSRPESETFNFICSRWFQGQG